MDGGLGVLVFASILALGQGQLYNHEITAQCEIMQNPYVAAMEGMQQPQGDHPHGTIKLKQSITGGPTMIFAELEGFQTSFGIVQRQHKLQIGGNPTPGCALPGAAFNPVHRAGAQPAAVTVMVPQLNDGTTYSAVKLPGISLIGANSALGRSIVIMGRRPQPVLGAGFGHPQLPAAGRVRRALPEHAAQGVVRGIVPPHGVREIRPGPGVQESFTAGTQEVAGQGAAAGGPAVRQAARTPVVQPLVPIACCTIMRENGNA